MKLKKKSVVAVLTLSMSMGSVLSMVPVFAETSQQNLALNKTAYVSAEYGTMPRKNLTDGNEKTRWSTESGPTQWAYIDLGQEYEMNKFQMFWEMNRLMPQLIIFMFLMILILGVNQYFQEQIIKMLSVKNY